MDYKEKLKLAKEALESGSYDRETIEYIFPELKESEDEKIKEDLIQWISEFPDMIWRGHYKKDILAWLKKQGEQKTIWHNEDEEPKRGSLILLIMQSGTPIVAKIIEPNHTFNHGERWAYIDDLLEKQGEKKNTKSIVEIWKNMRLEIYQQASGNRHEPNYSDDTTKMFSLNDIDEIFEKIAETCEQKPVDYENTTIVQKDFAPKSAKEAIKEEKVDNANKVEPEDYNSIDPHFGKPIDKVEIKEAIYTHEVETGNGNIKALIPEKIHIDDPTGEFDNHWSIYQNNDSIEYIHTDAFIEKAVRFLKEWDSYRVCLEGHKDWFIEQFKKYMEG